MNHATTPKTPLRRQAGLTLIELTVVLLVLIGLAGLLLPYAGGFVGRTHDSTGAANVGAVAEAIQRYDAQYAGLPSDLDRLVLADGSATTPYLMNATVATAAGVTAVQTGSLFRGGITSLQGVCDGDAAGAIGTADADADCATFNPTFDYYDATSDWTIAMNGNINGAAPAATDALPVVAAADVERVCGIDADPVVDADGDGTDDYVYFMLGVGQGSDMTGRTMTDAPVHFAQTAAMNADNRYNRFVVIVRADNDQDSNGWEGARFTCAAMAMGQLEGQQEAIQRFYDRVENEG